MIGIEVDTEESPVSWPNFGDFVGWERLSVQVRGRRATSCWIGNNDSSTVDSRITIPSTAVGWLGSRAFMRDASSIGAATGFPSSSASRAPMASPSSATSSAMATTAVAATAAATSPLVEATCVQDVHIIFC